MIEAHVAALQKKCEHLEHRIHDEMTHPGWDELAVRRLKQEKLHLEDEIARLCKDERH